MANKDDMGEILFHMKSFLLKKLKYSPEIAVICGSGLGKLADCVQDRVVIKYSDIENFPQATVIGHQGNLVFGKINSKPVMLMQGRFHLYEGKPVKEIALPIRLMKVLGITTLIVTNAAGGVNKSYSVGDIVFINDHINIPSMAGMNPLIGPNDESFGPRFPSLVNAYDKSLIKLGKAVSQQLGLKEFVREGVYYYNVGPCFETPAEVRYISAIGGDLAGMSTVHEVMVATHSGIRCLALSLVTNLCAHSHSENRNPSHEEVLEVGHERADVMMALISEIIKQL